MVFSDFIAGPSFIFGWHWGYWVALELAILSSSFYIPQRQLKWGILAILLQELIIMMGFFILYHSLGHPLIFTVVCTVWAGLSMGIIIHGKHLRGFASWILIPSLYFAIDFKDSPFVHSISHNWAVIAQLLAIAAAGPILVCIYEYVMDKNNEFVLWGFNGALHPQFDFEEVGTIAALMLAVLMASIIVWQFNLPHAEWIIWSTASVSTGQIQSMRKKIFHRGSGAIIGLVLGLTLVVGLKGYSPFLFQVAALLIPFTLFLDVYPLAFASRCTLIVLAAGSVAHGEFEAGYRILNVILGGMAGGISGYLIYSLSRTLHYK